jgi:hypothetical protein
VTSFFERGLSSTLAPLPGAAERPGLSVTSEGSMVTAMLVGVATVRMAVAVFEVSAKLWAVTW